MELKRQKKSFYKETFFIASSFFCSFFDIKWRLKSMKANVRVQTATITCGYALISGRGQRVRATHKTVATQPLVFY